MKPSLEVVLSPTFLPYYKLEDKIVVVIDVLRATSSICVAFAHGAERILPVGTPEECLAYKEQGFICAAERNGEVVPGFDKGNSPFSYMGDDIQGSTIALTTTNGTKAIQESQHAAQVVVGSFLNLSYLSDWLKKQNQSVVLLCAGWKGKFNLEDTLFAGAMVYHLQHDLTPDCDSSIAALDLYSFAHPDLYQYVLKSSHSQRFKRLGIEKDIAYCLQQNTINIIPKLEGDFLVKLEA